MAARVEFTQPAGRGPKPKKSLAAGRYTLFDSGDWLTPTPGQYEFTVRRGPEFQDVKAGFTLERNAKDAIEIVVPHKTPMRLFGWYSGDLSSSLSPNDLQRWMRAEGLDIAATSKGEVDRVEEASEPSERTVDLDLSSTEKSPLSVPLGANGEPDWTKTPCPAALGKIFAGAKSIDIPETGGIVIHRYRESTAEAKQQQEGSSQTEANPRPIDPFALLEAIPKNSSAHIELTRPWERDVPLVLATDKVNSIQLLSEALKPDVSLALSSKIRNPDSLRFKGTKGLGRLAEYIYWQMLEAGFRVPLTAGSGFTSKGDTVLGYNRVYVFLETPMKRNSEAWWRQIRQGATVVTNGPLIVPKINGLPPGSVQTGYRGQTISLDIELDLTVRDPVEYLDVVFNGTSIYQARLEDHARRGSFPALEIRESGWLVFRVVTEHEKSYRLVTTSPYYFEFDQRRISRKAVRFFQDWLQDSLSSIQNDSELKQTYDQPLAVANRFWDKRLANATAD